MVELVLVIIFTLHLHQVQGAAFEKSQETLEKLLSGKVDKHWHKLIKRYLEEGLCRKYSSTHMRSILNQNCFIQIAEVSKAKDKCLVQSLEYVHKYTKVFTQYNAQWGGRVNKFQYPECTILKKLANCEYMLVSRPLGLLPIFFGNVPIWECSLPSWCKTPTCHQQECWRLLSGTTHLQLLTYEFRIPWTSLRLNLTIRHLHWQSVGCGYHRINVRLAKGAKWHTRFCGGFPVVSIYPPSSKVFLDSIFPMFTFGNTDMQFSMIDANIVSHKKHQCFEKSQELGIVYHLHKLKTCLHYYHVQVEHYKVLHLVLTKRSNTAVKIFDGPGMKSDILKTRSAPSVFTSSSFQVVIQYRNTNHAILNVSTSLVNYPITNNDKSIILINKESNLSLSLASGVCKSKQTCILHLLTKNQTILNISLSQFVKTEEDTERTDYSTAGLALYSTEHIPSTGHTLYNFSGTVKQTAGQQFHLTMITKLEQGRMRNSYTHKNQTYITAKVNSTLRNTTVSLNRQHIYSTRNEFLLVFYSHKQYSTLNLTLSVKELECMGSTWVGPTQRHTTQKIVLNGSEQCSVLQILRQQQARHRPKVFWHSFPVTIATGSFPFTGQRISFSATGFLKGGTLELFVCLFAVVFHEALWI